MRAHIGPCGLNVNITPKDKSKLFLHCSINRFPNILLDLYIVDSTNSKGFEEPGFHIQGFPDNVPLSKCDQIDVYLSHDRWVELTTKSAPDSVFEGNVDVVDGFFGSRCSYDRFTASYYCLKSDNLFKF